MKFKIIYFRHISCGRQFIISYLRMLCHIHTISVDIRNSQMAAQYLILCHLKNIDLNSFIVLLEKGGKYTRYIRIKEQKKNGEE